ncbi:hypothetical protein [Thermococcus sp.]
MRRAVAYALIVSLFFFAIPLCFVEGGESYWINIYESERIWSGETKSIVLPNGDIVVAFPFVVGGSKVDVGVAYISQDGSVKWAKVYGSKYSEYPGAIVATTSGNIIIAANIDVYDDTGYDVVVFCLDSSGNVIWRRILRGEGDEEVRDATLAKDGNPIFVGITDSELEKDGIWIFKVSASKGDILWQRVYYRYFDNEPVGLGGWSIDTLDNGELVVGALWREGQAIVLKIEPKKGTVVWSRMFESRGGNIVVKSMGDNILLSTSVYLENSPNEWLVRLNSDGKVLWEKAYLLKSPFDTYTGKFYSIEVTLSGILIGGVNNKDYPLAFMMMVDREGNSLWHIVWNEKTEDIGMKFSRIYDVFFSGNAVWGIGKSGGNLMIMKLPENGNIESTTEISVEVRTTNIKSNDIVIRPKTANVPSKSLTFRAISTITLKKTSYPVTVSGTSEPSQQPTQHPKPTQFPTESQWVISYGGTEDETIYDVKITPDGGIIAVGVTSSFGAGNNDVWVIRLNREGQVLWQKTYGGKGDDTGYAVAVTPEGEFIIAASTNSFGSGDYDFWLLKLDKHGNIKWEMTYGGEYGEGAMDVALMPNGDIIVVGYTGSFGAGNFDVWILRLDSAGNLKWQKSYGGFGEDIALAVDIIKSADIVVTGYTTSFGAGGEDGWVLYLDGNGNVKWERTLGNRGDDELWGVSVDKNGNIVAAGFLMGSNEYEKAWVVQFDDKGNVKWQKVYGEEEYGDVALDVDTNSNYIVIGGATQNFDTEETGTWILYLDNEGNIMNEIVCEKGESLIWSVSLIDTSVIAGGYFTSKGSDALIVKMSLDKPPECPICWKSTATVKTAITQVKSSKTQSESTKGKAEGSRAQVIVSDAELNSYCPIEKESKKETTGLGIHSSETTTKYTYPSSEFEEEKGGICGTGAVIVLALFAAALSRK